MTHQLDTSRNTYSTTIFPKFSSMYDKADAVYLGEKKKIAHKNTCKRASRGRELMSEVRGDIKKRVTHNVKKVLKGERRQEDEI